jgi:hypothetical protein
LRNFSDWGIFYSDDQEECPMACKTKPAPKPEPKPAKAPAKKK